MSPETELDLKPFAQNLFDTMVAAVNMGITPPMTFALRKNGVVEIETLPDKLGPLLSNGSAKDTLFAWWRKRCADPAVEAFACGSETWGFAQNEAGAKFEKEKPSTYRAMIDHGFTILSAAGYGEVSEGFHLVAQTRESVIIMTRQFRRIEGQIQWTDEAFVGEFDQDHFRGRQKMWGDLRPENLS